VSEDLENGMVLNGVKGFFEVDFQHHTGDPRSLALVQVFKGPSEAVLDGTALDEAILVSVNKFEYPKLKTIGQQLSENFQNTVEKRDWTVIIDCFRC
jgi:hypothetical protein